MYAYVRIYVRYSSTAALRAILGLKIARIRAIKLRAITKDRQTFIT